MCIRDSHVAEPDVPHQLLEDILQSELPADVFAANVSGNDTSPDLVDSIHTLLATQLEVVHTALLHCISHMFSLSLSLSLSLFQVSKSTISNVQITTVAKYIRPLVQVIK